MTLIRTWLKHGALGWLIAASAWAAQEVPEVAGETVEMPPFVVTRIADGPEWRYASIPGFEILTQCSDRETREIVAALWRGPQLTLPAAMRPHFSLPMTVVLFDQAPTRANKPGGLGSARAQGEIQTHWTNVIKRTLEDRESFSVNLWGRGFSYSSTFRFDQWTLFRRRAPAVPSWLNEGMFGPYGVHREGVLWEKGDSQKRVHVGSWYSEKETAAAQKITKVAKLRLSQHWAAHEPSELLPFVPDLPFILGEPPRDDAGYARWASAAGLFVRWGIFSRPLGNGERFWKFAELASTRPVTEKDFADCFGQSYAEVRNELSWYLAVAVTMEAIAPVEIVPPPKITLRPATNAEVARVRGEWERMEAAALRTHYPDFSKEYREQAARTMEPAYQKGSRDPRLLASLGFLAMESGQFAKARELLEAAVAGQVAGPGVYLALARLRWAHEMTDEQGTLSAENRGAILDLLTRAERQQPPIASIYLLIAQLVRQNAAVTPEQTEILQRGLRLFPANVELRQRVDQALAPRSAASLGSG